jgi:hypothetical protein
MMDDQQTDRESVQDVVSQEVVSQEVVSQEAASRNIEVKVCERCWDYFVPTRKSRCKCGCWLARYSIAPDQMHWLYYRRLKALGKKVAPPPGEDRLSSCRVEEAKVAKRKWRGAKAAVSVS